MRLICTHQLSPLYYGKLDQVSTMRLHLVLTPIRTLRSSLWYYKSMQGNLTKHHVSHCNFIVPPCHNGDGCKHELHISIVAWCCVCLVDCDLFSLIIERQVCSNTAFTHVQYKPFGLATIICPSKIVEGYS